MAQLSRPSSPDNNTQQTTDAIDFSNARTEVALRAIMGVRKLFKTGVRKLVYEHPF